MKTAKASPLRGTVSFVPVGATLFHTLVAGLVDPAGFVPEQPTGPDRCPWEADLPDPTAPRPAPNGILDVLTRQHMHAALLTADPDGPGTPTVTRARLTVAHTDYVTETGGDPYLAWDPESGKAMVADRRWATWRDLRTLTGDAREDRDYDAPAAATAARALPATHVPDRVRVLAVDQERAQDRSYAWWSATTPPLIAAANADPAVQAAIDAAVTAAETAGGALEWALARTRAATLHLDPGKKASPHYRGNTESDSARNQIRAWADPPSARFWVEAERVFLDTLDTHDGSPDLAADVAATLTARYRSLALALFDEYAHAVHRPEHVRAVVEQRSRLRSALTPRAAAPDSPAPTEEAN